MSVDLVRFDGDWNNMNSEIIFSYPVASENFFRNVWVIAINDTQLKLFRDWGTFTPAQVDEALDELHILIEWCEQNLKGEDYIRFKDRIEDLMTIIPEEVPNSDEPFHIF